MFRWGLLFWLHWLLWILVLCIKKIFSCIRNLILTGMVFAGMAICTIAYLTGLSIAELFLLIWDCVGAVIDLIKRI